MMKMMMMIMMMKMKMILEDNDDNYLSIYFEIMKRDQIHIFISIIVA